MSGLVFGNLLRFYCLTMFPLLYTALPQYCIDYMFG